MYQIPAIEVTQKNPSCSKSAIRGNYCVIRKFDKIDLNIAVRLLQRCISLYLAVEPTKEEIATASRSTANTIVVGPDEHLMEFLRVWPHDDPRILCEFPRNLKMA